MKRTDREGRERVGGEQVEQLGSVMAAWGVRRAAEPVPGSWASEAEGDWEQAGRKPGPGGVPQQSPAAQGGGR